MTVDHPSWSVKGNAILDELVTLMNLSADESALLASMQSQARAIAPKMTEAFYDRLFKHQNTAEYLQNATMERLHSMVGDWFVELFNGSYGTAYVEKRLGIGKIHVRIGLPVRYPLAMLDVVMAFAEQVARQSAQPEQAIVACRKVLALDVAIFNQAYENTQLEYLSDLVGGERLARLLLSGHG
jgi:hypothetical protein